MTEQSNNIAQPLENTLNQFLKVANVNNVYGQPIVQGNTVIIPSAELTVALGFGFGQGNDGKDNSGGGGGGGGGKAFARPVAVIIATPESVRVEPVMDATKIALAGITLAGFIWATLRGFVNPMPYLSKMKHS